MTREDELVSELRDLRKGRGLNEPKLDERLGPHLRAAVQGRLATIVSAGEHASNGQVRLAITDMVMSAARGLPQDLRLAVEVMFATESSSNLGNTLSERQANLAVQWQYEIRTVRRRCDGAVQLLAERLARGDEIVDTVAPAPSHPSAEEQRREQVFVAGTWYTERLAVLLRLDSEPVSAREERTIVALANGLNHITASTGLLVDSPDSVGPLDEDVEFGGRTLSREHHPGGVSMLHIQISRTLLAGERYRYGRILSLTADHHLRPRYIFMPGVKCSRFDLTVRFHPDRLPRLAWAHRGVPYRVADSATPGADRVAVDPIGEVSLSFDDLHLGSAYGLGWQWNEDIGD